MERDEEEEGERDREKEKEEGPRANATRDLKDLKMCTSRFRKLTNPYFLSPHGRRASFLGAPESPQLKNSTENSNEALSPGGCQDDEGADNDGKHHRSSSSSLQRHCLSDGVFLVVEEAKNDDGLTVSTRGKGEREKRQRTRCRRSLSKIPSSHLVDARPFQQQPTFFFSHSSPRPPLSSTCPPEAPAPTSSSAPSTTSRRSSRE